MSSSLVSRYSLGIIIGNIFLAIERALVRYLALFYKITFLAKKLSEKIKQKKGGYNNNCLFMIRATTLYCAT